ncbi:ethanolamine ammonia-lyase subunit EutC [Alloacidobacterium sp.]|uniref:ethanolamine ammonia-lyase subunit EutC n=1 Tax=Alloacidobacterium sp. TaxID=2951999 RepID=UPI002D536D11|nr:ethanolamine ammonia-lyase subunit EutC [Alloacidobacterium sp.]HYK37203.1 ethanolamine ammonia-lyase subunit EutC [Alloacidobacterium sp.]
MSEIIQNPWTRLRSFTNARLALGRAGDSLPTHEVLEFALAHAQARDAVHDALDVDSVARDLAASGFQSIAVQSAARDRAEYLKRPDLGRELSDESRSLLQSCHPDPDRREGEGPALSTNQSWREASSVLFIIADGLSAIAPARHAIPVLNAIIPRLGDWNIAPIIVATQTRVALGDEIGELLKAEVTVMLIGERPGLSSPHSLGIYLTYKPHIGSTDADRNCISNVRPEGLGYEGAAHKLHYLMIAARGLGRSGVALKDESYLQRLDESSSS